MPEINHPGYTDVEIAKTREYQSRNSKDTCEIFHQLMVPEQ
ncbi:MAG: hypothetical protein AAB472_02785 [Patescibacteria group bacterium]